MAVRLYKRVGDLFDDVDSFKGDKKTRAKELKRQCQLNMAACYLRLEDYAEALVGCESVLSLKTANNSDP